MSPLQLPKMIYSFHDGWDELERMHPSVWRVFALFVLPLSLLPAVVIYFAGAAHGNVFVPDATAAEWHRAAAIFLVAELLTVPLVAWLIHETVKVFGNTVRYYDSFLLAAIAPSPLWLSSLAMLVPSLVFNIGVGLAALACSVGLIYHGVATLFKFKENINAQMAAMVISGVGLLSWLLLVQFVLVHY